jgi:uncharacterized protein YxeA
MKKTIFLVTLLYFYSVPIFADMMFKIYGAKTFAPTVSSNLKLAGYKTNGKPESRILNLNNYKSSGEGLEYKLCASLDWMEAGYLYSNYKAEGTGGETSGTGKIEFATTSLEGTVHLIDNGSRDGFQMSLSIGWGGVTIGYKDDELDFVALGKEWHLRGTATYNLTTNWGLYFSYLSQNVTMVTGNKYTNAYKAGGVTYSF